MKNCYHCKKNITSESPIEFPVIEIFNSKDLYMLELMHQMSISNLTERPAFCSFSCIQDYIRLSIGFLSNDDYSLRTIKKHLAIDHLNIQSKMIDHIAKSKDLLQTIKAMANRYIKPEEHPEDLLSEISDLIENFEEQMIPKP